MTTNFKKLQSPGNLTKKYPAKKLSKFWQEREDRRTMLAGVDAKFAEVERRMSKIEQNIQSIGAGKQVAVSASPDTASTQDQVLENLSSMSPGQRHAMLGNLN